MNQSLSLNISISFNQLVDIAKQLPKSEQKKLVRILNDDDPSKEDILEGLKDAINEVNLAKRGKIKLKSAREFLDEL